MQRLRRTIYHALLAIAAPFKGFGLRKFAFVRYALAFTKPRKVTIHGHVMYIDPTDETVSRQIMEGAYEPFETEAMVPLVKKGNVVVDMGAHIGYYTVLFARQVGSTGEVYAFEPYPSVYALLEKNIKANGYTSQVHASQLALSEAVGMGRLYINTYNKGDNRIFRSFGPENNVVDIHFTTLDEVIPPGKKVDFIKVDIQGAEVLALRGAKRVIQESKPQIFCEFDPRFLKAAGTSARELLDALSGYGYSFENFDNASRSLISVTKELLLEQFPDTADRSTNILCTFKNV